MFNTFLLIISLLFSINSQFILINKKPVSFSHFEVDKMENIYGINNNAFFNYSSTNKQYNYTNNLLGAPSLVDVTNPLQIILFYKSNNSLVFLDNTLNEIRSPVMLDNLQIYNTSIFCSSRLGGIWIYDDLKKRILYINKYLEIEIESPHIENIIDIPAKPDFIKEHQSKLYINIPGKGILEFNQNGTYLNTLPIITSEVIQIQQQKIYYISSDSIGFYNILTKNNYIVPLPEKKFKIVRIQNDKLYIFMDNYLSIYKIID